MNILSWNDTRNGKKKDDDILVRRHSRPTNCPLPVKSMNSALKWIHILFKVHKVCKIVLMKEVNILM